MTSTVPPGRASLHRYPGTSCLATISLSLRDKRHSPIEELRIKLALTELKPWAESACPFKTKKDPKETPAQAELRPPGPAPLASTGIGLGTGFERRNRCQQGMISLSLVEAK
jgi:hypothetical protein